MMSPNMDVFLLDCYARGWSTEVRRGRLKKAQFSHAS
jgi:hypothetical protein